MFLVVSRESMHFFWLSEDGVFSLQMVLSTTKAKSRVHVWPKVGVTGILAVLLSRRRQATVHNIEDEVSL